MEKSERKNKQLKLARIFYEMGMEEEVILKISNISKEEFEDVKKYKEVDKK